MPSCLLALMSVLYGVNRFWTVMHPSLHYIGVAPRVPEHLWQNSRLNAKLRRQSTDVLTLCASTWPAWTLHISEHLPFLFSFDTRRLLYRASANGVARALHHLVQSNHESVERVFGDVQVGRIRRHKVRIARDRILESARRVFEIEGTSRDILEVEYYGEEGTGNGPTQEFFSLVSRKLQSLPLWYVDSAAQRATALRDLWPQPIAPVQAVPAETLSLFRFIGAFCAKALIDERLIDLPLSPVFWRVVLRQPVSLVDLAQISPQLYQSLTELVSVAQRRRDIEQNTALSDSERSAQLAALTLSPGSPKKVEDLWLQMTLFGFSQWEVRYIIYT